MTKKYKIGLLVGRFQPFHKGHLWLIRHSLTKVESLIIGVGSANQKNHDNFLDYEERKKMLEKVIEIEKLQDRVTRIVPLDDFFNDDKWYENTLKIAGPIDAIIGNNEWTNKIFETRGYPILRVGFYKRYLYEGERIRKLMRNKKRWQDRVPKYLVEYLQNILT